MPLSMGCSGGTRVIDDSAERVESVAQPLTEDGLADAYTEFKRIFVTLSGFNQVFPIGYGYHPGLSTEKLVFQGHTPKGRASINFAQGRVTASLDDVDPSLGFDLYFVKNIAGTGKTVKPETGDTFVKVGTFNVVTPTGKSLDVTIGTSTTTGVNFDLDLMVVTRAGKKPDTSVVAVGSRTLFEKRFFREAAGGSLDPVTGTLANNVETNDPLVRRGAQLFFNETFAGNGRTCGTCHRQENNLTIDANFIATLPQSDPLFVSENNPALAGLEDSTLLRQRALIRENLDGFDVQPVQRSTNHTFALNTTNGIQNANTAFPDGPPDHRLGWGGDGAPGRGTLNEFSFGAIVQHLTKRFNRVPGTDFRIPTQDELDALEAFQLFTGRPKLVDARVLVFREPAAQTGQALFLDAQNGGKCTNCHIDMGSTLSPPVPVQLVVNTGVALLTPDLPFDNGFLDGRNPASAGGFNVPPLIEAADTPPFFHNNGKADIEAAVGFYAGPEFRSTQVGAATDINIDTTQQAQIAAFLRVLNAAENIRQVRKRVQFVHDNRSTGNTDILTFAIRDAQDAIDVLSAKNLNLAAQNDMANVKQTMIIAKAQPDANRPAYLDNALVYLGLAKGELFTSNPNNDF
jgi:cytochrome c peroxidase